MQAAASFFGVNTIAFGILGITEAIIAMVVMTNASVPIIGNNRITLITFIIIGFAMCSMGMEIPQYGWTNPFNIIGIGFGVIALGIGITVIFGARLPFITDERMAILAISGLMVVKIIIASVRGIVS